MAKKVEEIIVKKTSVFLSRLENMHLLETVSHFIETHENNFTERSWNCNIRTSNNMCSNILYDIDEFEYLTTEIELTIKAYNKKIYGKNIPFCISNSWINILGMYGYQEPHIHPNHTGSGILYLTDNNSEIEFIVYPEDYRKSLKPNKGDILLFDSYTYHRVVESKQKRMSLAFNYRIQA
tara:strand:+ start:1690 stop:2229 length:540 start_codon:yes stop_codon:yes gene_type:complete